MKNLLLPVHWFANRLHACLSQKITWAGLCLYSESKESGREIVNTLAFWLILANIFLFVCAFSCGHHERSIWNLRDKAEPV